MSLIEQALARRASISSPDTTIVRLIDGSGDGFPGITLDQFGEHFLISSAGPPVPADLKKWAQGSGRSVYFKKLDQKEKDSPTLLSGPPVDGTFIARENGLSFELSFSSGYSQGIFPDQRLNRAQVISRSTAGNTVLNTFAYTGAFSVCAASSGATATTLDLSQPYLQWGRRNMQLNGISPDSHFFCKGDTFHWLGRFARQGRSFDGIILDPPTFARDHKGKVFRIEKDYGRLTELALDCLAPGGWLLACTNYRQMSTKDFERVISSSCKARARIRSAEMPPEYTADAYLKSVWLELQ